MDRQSAVAQLRAAAEQFARVHLDACDRWSVGLSGGPDSLALTAVAARLWPTTALIVDHGLQPGSATVAETARIQAISLGCVDARVLCVQVGAAGGREAAARSARYSALEEHRDGPVLLAHTLDDQAETVLLGLGRGSGARSIAGMRPYDPPWCRPLLGVRRSVTHAACRELGLTAWQDPHNTDRRFTRTRLRTEVLPLLEDVLGGGVAEALARTATALREDTDLIDTIAAQALPGAAVAGSRGTGVEYQRLDRAAGCGAAPGDSGLAAGRRRDRTDRQADPRSGPAGHRVARSGRGSGWVHVARSATGRRAARRRTCVAARARLTPALVVGPAAWHAVHVTQSSSAITPGQTAELYPGDIKSVLLTAEQIQARIAELGEQIGNDYRELSATTGQDLLLITVLKGAVLFVTDLARAIPVPTQFEFMAVSSYGSSTSSSGVVRILKDLDRDIHGRDVLIVEDVVDSGLTLSWLSRNLTSRNPRSLRVCTLLRKPDAVHANVEIAYVGFDIPNDFVVGYGLDYDERYRDLSYIGTLDPRVYQ